MNITSNNTMIFAKEFDGKMHYRAGMSRKNQNNEYEKAYIDVRLPKDVSVADRTKINITKGFLTFYKTKDGKDIWYIVIQEFTAEGEVKEEPVETDPYANFGKQTEVYVVKDVSGEQLDLPF